MDELNDETEARMDALEDRTRALAARVDALTAERDEAVKALDDLRVSWGSLQSNHAAQVRGSLELKGERDLARRLAAESAAREQRMEEAMRQLGAERDLVLEHIETCQQALTRAGEERASLLDERDTARKAADRWHGMAHRMEVERDAAVKRAEEAEAREGRLRADLREWATPPTGMGASLYAETWPVLTPSARRRMLRLAALSPSPEPSPVSGAAEKEPSGKDGGR